MRSDCSARTWSVRDMMRVYAPANATATSPTTAAAPAYGEQPLSEIGDDGDGSEHDHDAEHEQVKPVLTAHRRQHAAHLAHSVFDVYGIGHRGLSGRRNGASILHRLWLVGGRLGVGRCLERGLSGSSASATSSSMAAMTSGDAEPAEPDELDGQSHTMTNATSQRSVEMLRGPGIESSMRVASTKPTALSPPL